MSWTVILNGMEGSKGGKNMKLKKLTKAELLHLLDCVIGEDEVLRLFKENRHFQKAHGIKCWDCEAIEKKFEEA